MLRFEFLKGIRSVGGLWKGSLVKDGLEGVNRIEKSVLSVDSGFSLASHSDRFLLPV